MKAHSLRRSLLKPGIVGGLGMVSLLLINPAQAANFIDGGFESGSFAPNWTSSGNTSIETSAFGSGPTEGTNQGLLATGAGATAIAGLESFLGLSPGDLDRDFLNTATQGSAIQQTVMLDQDDSIQFDLQFLTDDTSGAFGDRDYAFLVINGTVTFLAGTESTLGPSSTVFSQQTGFFTFNTGPLAAGNYTVSFGVVDISDSLLASGLLVDNVQVVPIPFNFQSTLGLVSLGLLGAIGYFKRQKRNYRLGDRQS
jgi:hypothetical protein